MAHDYAIREERHTAPLVRAVTQRCRALFRDLFDPYRPERHYMRGPGPKWRERHLGAQPRA
ncbi:MAG: hypothetical protein QOD74_3100 [Variibacter sp.]|jgi:hypothetical protein|nr:hypothetical protein [Variibacter sp.]